MSKPMDYRNETVVLWWCGAMEPALNQGDREYNSKQPVGHRPAPRCASVGLKASESTIKALFEEECARQPECRSLPRRCLNPTY
ncbi:hypothetical protein Y032_0739g1959 [Ancylostoma ceylanicum]|uniref:Uncharacterized protein n=1 Tax=Ancylostoma ceylanicum TaxID=53326 RepID=A0A016WEX2_9BILA|nr:hypothetical protein Y032_0739g1959 [Ancylostoma ceylanicum]